MQYVPTNTWNGNQIYLLSTALTHNLARELQMLSRQPKCNTQSKRPSLWTFEQLDTLLTFLYFYADGRPDNTRFNRCAQNMPYLFDPDLCSAWLHPASVSTGFSATICLRSLLFGGRPPQDNTP